MKRLGLAVVVLALSAPGVEASPDVLSFANAREGTAAYLARDVRQGTALSGSVGRCIRASKRVIDCKLSVYGMPPDEDLGSTSGWFWVRVRLRRTRREAYARDFIDLANARS